MTDSGGRSAPPGTQSVLRAISLLKALTDHGPELDLGELTEEVGLARTTTHRLLSALESEGLVARSRASGAYRLGPIAIAMGAQALRANDLRDLARPFLEALAQRSGESVTLEVISGHRMLIIDEVSGRHLVMASADLGTAWAIHGTASGKAVLAAMPEEARDEILARPLARLTNRTITDAGALRRDLRRAANRGYAITREELTEGFSAVGAAIRDAEGQPVAAIALGGPPGRMPRSRLDELGPHVAAAAAKVSALLGHRG
jgi:DNA-binding IclR family transcriptional regulator